MDATTKHADSPVGSVDKALVLVELLGDAGPSGVALRDLVSASGFNKASAHRLLQALIHRGFAEQDAAGLYRLGATAVLLVERFLGEENLPALFRPALLEISHEVQELVHLGSLDSQAVTYLDKVEPNRAIRVWSRIGRQASPLTTALGRAMVAAEGVPAERLDVYAAGASDEVAARFRSAVASARSHGYAIEQEENEPGIACVAVAMLRAGGRPVAVSITGPTSRMTRTRLESLGDRLREVLSSSAPSGFSVAAL